MCRSKQTPLRRGFLFQGNANELRTVRPDPYHPGVLSRVFWAGVICADLGCIFRCCCWLFWQGGIRCLLLPKTITGLPTFPAKCGSLHQLRPALIQVAPPHKIGFLFVIQIYSSVAIVPVQVTRHLLAAHLITPPMFSFTGVAMGAPLPPCTTIKRAYAKLLSPAAVNPPSARSSRTNTS